MTNFTILMSIYLGEKPEYLEECLKSIHLQTISINEIIIVKDGPIKKETEIVLNRYLQKWPTIYKIISLERNMGLGVALATGVLNSSNELIFRMDTDDIMAPNRLELQLKEYQIQKNKNANIAIIGSSIEEFNETPGDLQIKRITSLDSNTIKKNLLWRNQFNHMTVLFEKSKIIECGNYQEMPNYEDYYLWIRLLTKYDGINMNTPLVYARTNKDFISRRSGVEFFQKEIFFLKRIWKEGFVNSTTLVLLILMRGLPRIIGKRAIRILYKVILRKKN